MCVKKCPKANEKWSPRKKTCILKEELDEEFANSCKAGERFC